MKTDKKAKKTAKKTARKASKKTANKAAKKTARKTTGKTTSGKKAGKAAEKKKVEPKKQAPSPKQPEAKLLELDEMAKRVRMHPLQLKKMARSGQVPGVKVEGRWLFNPELVSQALKRRSTGR